MNVYFPIDGDTAPEELMSYLRSLPKDKEVKVVSAYVNEPNSNYFLRGYPQHLYPGLEITYQIMSGTFKSDTSWFVPKE